MGVSLIEVYSRRPPLLGLSEQMAVIPGGRETVVNNPNFKVLYFFTGGVVMRLADGSAYEIAEGDIVVVPREHSPAYRYSAGPMDWRFHAMALSFDARPPGADALAQWLRQTFRGPLHLRCAAMPDGGHALWRVVMAIRRACEGNDAWGHLLACELARVMLLRIGAAAGLAKGPSPLADAVRVAAYCHRVRRGNAVPPPDEEAAFFEARTGFRPLRLLHWLRVERARTLLLGSAEPVGRIATQLGFASGGAFSRVFREVSGFSPMQYRRLHPANTRFSIRDNPPDRHRPLHAADHPEAWCWQWHTEAVRLGGEGLWLVLPLRGCPQVHLPDGVVNLPAREPRALVAAVPLRIEGRGCRVAVLEVAGFEGAVGFSHAVGPGGSKWLVPKTPGGFLPLQEALSHRPANRYQRLLLHSLTSALVYETLAPPGRKRRSVLSGQPSEVLVETVKEYVRKHCANPLTLGEIAYAVGVSEEHLARVFRAATGATVMSFVFTARAQWAHRLLRRGHHSIAEVAYESGFQTVGHFYRVYRKVYGRTPGAVRREG